jgi:hypothetical protein
MTGHLRVKLILPALTEATSPFFRPIKYSLFPPLGLATLAAYLRPDDEAVIVDEHVETLTTADRPDLVVIQVYITNAYRASRLADHYRAKGCFVALGGLHVTSLPIEAAAHADAIFLGPGEQMFPQFLEDFRAGRAARVYRSTEGRTLDRVPPIRRDLIKRRHYLVPNSIVVTRGCPQHCEFCYKDAFFTGGRGFYTQRVGEALAEIDRLRGRHLYFLDDHLLGDPRFGRALFDGMRGMNRLFQGAATVDSILRGNLIEHAAEAGLRSLFVGFETLTPGNLIRSNALPMNVHGRLHSHPLCGLDRRSRRASEVLRPLRTLSGGNLERADRGTVPAPDHDLQQLRRRFDRGNLVLADHYHVVVVSLFPGLDMREPVPVSGQHEVDARAVCHLGPFRILAIDPAPLGLVHHYDPERRGPDAISRSDVFVEPRKFLLPIRFTPVQPRVHVRVVCLVLARVHHHQVHRTVIPRVIEAPFRRWDVPGQLARERAPKIVVPSRVHERTRLAQRL